MLNKAYDGITVAVTAMHSRSRVAAPTALQRLKDEHKYAQLYM
jgi:hypothetical protein